MSLAAEGATPATGIRLSGGYRDFQDYNAGDGTRVPSGARGAWAGLGAVWQPKDDQTIRVSALFDSDRDARFASLPLDMEEDDARIGTLHYELRPPLERVRSLRALVYGSSVHHRMTNANKPNAGMLKVAFPLDSATVGGRLGADLDGPADSELSAGADLFFLRRDGTNRIRFLAGPNAGSTARFRVWPDSRVLNGGLYAEWTQPLPGPFELAAGARVDLIDARADFDARARQAFDRFYGEGTADEHQFDVLPSAFLRTAWQPREAAELWIGLAYAGRTPDAVERHFTLGPGPGGFFVGNPRLDPERALAVDVGGRLGDRGFNVEGAFFYRSLSDFILETLLSRTDVNGDGIDDAVRGYVNIDRASLLGAEGAATWSPLPWLTASGSISWVRGTNEEDDRPLPEIPPLEGRLAVRLQHDRGERYLTWIELALRVTARQNRNDAVFGEDETPGFLTAALRMGLQLGTHVECVLTVANLFDRTYHEHLTREDPFTGREVPEPGRILAAAVEVRY